MMKLKLGRKMAILGAAFILTFGATSAFASEGDTTSIEEGVGKQSEAYTYGIYVEEGIISEDTLDSIILYFEENAETLEAEKEAEKALLDEMTEEERATYLESNEPTSALDDLSTEGILTDDEVTAILEYNETNGVGGPGQMGQGPGQMGGQGPGGRNMESVSE